MTETEFKDYLNKNNIDITQEQLQLFNKYADYLLEYNKTTNLTAIKTTKEVYLKHFYDSIILLKHIDLTNENILDIGSGAGFPGVPLKILRPNIKLTLLDSNGKKTKFLQSLKEVLNLEYEVINSRAEEYVKETRETFDIVVSRAVASMPVLSELSLPFVKVNGKFIAYKGNINEDLEQGENAIKILSDGKIDIIKELLPIENSERTFVIITKNKPTDKIYPREYNKINKKPLR